MKDEALVMAAGPIAAELLRQWRETHQGVTDETLEDEAIAKCFERALRATAGAQGVGLWLRKKLISGPAS